MKGKFITIEGMEGAGKSTVVSFIKKQLEASAKNVVWTREPGGTPLAEHIRELVLHPTIDEKIYADTELLLLFAARAQHMQACILPALAAGKWVVSDRFVDASYAYQGAGRGVDIEHIKQLDRWIVGDHYPDLTLLLDISPEQGFIRTQKRGEEKDRIEQEALDFFARVRNAYLLRAEQDPQRIKMIDASLSLFEVEDQIRSVLGEFLK